MNAIEQAIAWIWDKRCGEHCLKCDGMLMRRFQYSDVGTRSFLEQTLCCCSLEDIGTYPTILWLVPLLDGDQYERFISHIATYAPYSAETAWKLIHWSEQNRGRWGLPKKAPGNESFQPFVHLHPSIAPLVLEATISREAAAQDAIAILKCFEPVAGDYPVLEKAIPAWQAEQARLEEARKALDALAKLDLLHRQEKDRARESDFRTIEARGPLAMMHAVLQAASLEPHDCSDRWAMVQEQDLASIPRDVLLQVAGKISAHRPRRVWTGLRNRIEHLQRSQAHTEERRACLNSLANAPLQERLRYACGSQWSLTYFPEAWAEEAVRCASEISPWLRNAMLAKSARLRHRGPWRDAKSALLLKTS